MVGRHFAHRAPQCISSKTKVRQVLLSLRLLISPLLIFQISFQSRSPLLLRLALRIECIDLLSEVSVFLRQRWNRDSVPVSCSCIQGGHR